MLASSNVRVIRRIEDLTDEELLLLAGMDDEEPREARH
jgi:hypothetical protein